MTPKQALAKIRKSLAAADRADVRQGIELAESLDVPEVNAVLRGGISVSAGGEVGWSSDSEIKRRVKPPHRLWAALRILRGAGALAASPRLNLEGQDVGPSLANLAPLWGLATLHELNLGETHLRTLDPFSRLPGLKRLSIRIAKLTRLDSLNALPGLESLTVGGCWRLRSLSDVDWRRSSLRALRTSGAQIEDLAPLQDLAGLEVLEIRGSYRLEALRPLREMTRLRSLGLPACPNVQDHGPISALTRLESLDLSESKLEQLPDLSGAAGLRRVCLAGADLLGSIAPLASLPLQALDLNGCAALRDLSPIADATSLRDLDVRQSPARMDAASLKGLTGLLEGCAIDPASGEVTRDGAPFSGDVYTLLQVEAEGEHPLAGLRHLRLARQEHLSRLDALGGFTALESVDLAETRSLQDAAPLMLSPGLARLNLDGCPSLRPAPARKALEDRASVERYQRKLARSLKRRSGRTPAQDALLARAEGLGLLERSEAEDIHKVKKRAVIKIRKLLAGPELADALQGFELLMALEDPDLVVEFSAGVSLSDNGRILLAPHATRRAHLRRRDRRVWAALAVLRASGALDDAPQIRLTHYQRLPNLAPIEGLPRLRVLELTGGGEASDVSVLATLPALERLDLRRCAQMPEVLRQRFEDRDAIQRALAAAGLR